jgi:hypothetical protein
MHVSVHEHVYHAECNLIELVHNIVIQDISRLKHSGMKGGKQV